MVGFIVVTVTVIVGLIACMLIFHGFFVGFIALSIYVCLGGYSGLDISDFLRQPRLYKAEEGSATEGVQAGYEGWNDEEEDERLLSSLADVANTLVAADSRAVIGDAAGLHSNSSVSAVISRFDMEWRNIL